MTNKVEFDKDKVEDKQLVIKIKHIVWAVTIIIVFLGSPLTWMYADVTDTVDEQNAGFDEWKVEQKEDRKEWLKEEFNPMRKEIQEMYKDLGIALGLARAKQLQPEPEAVHDTVFISQPPSS